MRFVVAVTVLLTFAPALAAAQPPSGVAPGSAAAALGVNTRDRSNPPPGSGALQIPVYPVSQFESCTSADFTLGYGSLRSGGLFNLFGAAKGCERRRDAWFMTATGDLQAARNRMCQERLNREAYEGSEHPCPPEKPHHWWSR